jgi:hypothetical protein
MSSFGMKYKPTQSGQSSKTWIKKAHLQHSSPTQSLWWAAVSVSTEANMYPPITPSGTEAYHRVAFHLTISCSRANVDE